MLRPAFACIFLFTLNASAQNAARKLWDELKVKREGYAGIHQEFEVVRTSRSAFERGSSKWKVVVDMAGDRWREVGGLGAPIKVFDGIETFTFEPDEKEYVRAKAGKNKRPAPSPYDLPDVDWSKAVDQGHIGCKVEGKDHPCVTLEVPMKLWIRKDNAQHTTQLRNGLVRLVLDTQTGLLMLSRWTENIGGRECPGCQRTTQYAAIAQAYGSAPDDGLFTLPAGHTQVVKDLPVWDAGRIKKKLLGQAAPEMTVTDLPGAQIELSSLRGKTVLLDFWASWCLPCRADLPSLRKLYQRYGGKDLEIIAIDLEEDRSVVEKYLKEHPAGYPVVLSSENLLPRTYQPNVIPTYVVISADGTVQGATEGLQGFFDLKDLLKKAGWNMN